MIPYDSPMFCYALTLMKKIIKLKIKPSLTDYEQGQLDTMNETINAIRDNAKKQNAVGYPAHQLANGQTLH